MYPFLLFVGIFWGELEPIIEISKKRWVEGVSSGRYRHVCIVDPFHLFFFSFFHFLIVLTRCCFVIEGTLLLALGGIPGFSDSRIP